VAPLSASTLYLDRNQSYRGHCLLIFDRRHAVGLETLTPEEFGAFASDLGVAAKTIAEVCQPDLMNYASFGNVMPHLHWHLIPRYRSDPRWGGPIFTTTAAEMVDTRLTEPEYRALASSIRAALVKS
jgi:diadenosine tetraphosphate (Ap4A) HIT family hydrolase